MVSKTSDSIVAIAPEDALVHVFGVRHLSPMGAWQLREFLDTVQPDLVMIEGLEDADDLVSDITRKGSVPPIAILAYTDSTPVRTLVYPFARYSPEYQALVWAKENKVKTEFIDLPSDIFLALQRDATARRSQSRDEADDDDNQTSDNQTSSDDPADADEEATPKVSWLEQTSLYSRIAQESGELDYDSYWERNFEHNTTQGSYRQSAFELGRGLRELESGQRADWAETLVREAFMRRKIKAAIDRGIPPEKIVAIVGAYHAPVLTGQHEPMTDDELGQLERLPSKLTLMPYSYFKLSSQSGYGAGNEAPAYFELLWESLEQNELNELAPRYLTGVTRKLRESGTHRSTAAVIEGVRLSRTLSAMKNGVAPRYAIYRMPPSR